VYILVPKIITERHNFAKLLYQWEGWNFYAPQCISDIYVDGLCGWVSTLDAAMGGTFYRIGYNQSIQVPTVCAERGSATRHRHPTDQHGSAIGASQPLDHGSGTVCQPGFASPTTTSENFVGSWSRFCSIDTAAHSDYFVIMRLLNSLTHSLSLVRSHGEDVTSWV